MKASYISVSLRSEQKRLNGASALWCTVQRDRNTDRYIQNPDRAKKAQKAPAKPAIKAFRWKFLPAAALCVGVAASPVAVSAEDLIVPEVAVAIAIHRQNIICSPDTGHPTRTRRDRATQAGISGLYPGAASCTRQLLQPSRNGYWHE